ncbi:MAG: rRNA maturation RNase YbeY [Parcubacteria group bacterium]|nr:rRNA maturation RNase YbeY [Parcubacteria group bacterium]|tara:strand:+ start:331 stop:720 length:390 start_codon:yes stop_codon:yes gene_type:complete
MAKISSSFDITHTTQGTLPSVPFEKIKKTILGQSYALSLVLIADTLAKRLNQEYKKRSNPTNILSFPLSETEGEIFLNIRRAKRDAKKFGHTTNQHIAFLFIHGCLHLKGTVHGKKMEKQEEILLRKLY